MAQPDPLPAGAPQAVVQQLGEFLSEPGPGAALALSRTSQPELRESLAICFVSAEQVHHPPTDLGPLVQPTGVWHHQVRTATGATHMAISRQQGFGRADVQVEQFVESPIAPKLDAAMAWVDRTLSTDATAVVRLLLIPAYYVHALVIIRKRKYSAVLVHQPSNFKQLQYEKEYSLRDFLKRLAKERMSTTLL